MTPRLTAPTPSILLTSKHNPASLASGSTPEKPRVMSQAPRDYRQEVTDSIIRLLEAGTAPWQKPWDARGSLSMPMNPTSGKAYRGGNALYLLAVSMERGYDDPRWMTYKQAQDNGWQVKKGEIGTKVEFWDVRRGASDDAEPNQTDDTDGSGDKSHSRLIHRIYTVFNASQIDGVPAFQPKQHTPFEAIQAGESILNHSGVAIHHDQLDRAYYSRSKDSIHLPRRELFKDAPSYYGTALHELAHATGHSDRLNRPTLNESYKFGDQNYAKEELRAELASVFLAAERGIPHNPEQHAAYVGSWIKALKNDKNEIFKAASDAAKATDYLLDLERGKTGPAAPPPQPPTPEPEETKPAPEAEPVTPVALPTAPPLTQTIAMTGPESLPIIARPEELDYTLACAAYSNTSHTPERRAKADQEVFADDVNGFYAEMGKLCTNQAQRALLDAEIPRYKENYLARYSAYLHSHSRVASSFITGPANFPVARNEKRSRWADNKMTEFTEWRERARTAIRERILSLRTEEEKTDAAWLTLHRELARSLNVIEEIDTGNSPYTRSAFVNSIVGKVERLANNGEADLVEKATRLVTAYNAQHKKPAITRSSKFWTFAEMAKSHATTAAQSSAEIQTLHTGEGVKVLLNPALDRVQIVFDAIPPATLREKMKSVGWHWSRQENAWQRKITEAAKYSARQVLGLTEFQTGKPVEASAPEPETPLPAPPSPPMTHAERLEKDRTLTLDLDFGVS